MKGERPLMVAGIYARIGGAVLCWLLTFAASTSADCAWVWLETVALEGTTWDYTDAYTTKDECSKVAQGYNRGPTQLGARQGKTTTSIGYRCMPDTVDPRGPKGK